MPREKILCGKEDVFSVAIEIVDRDGADALSVRAIAKELGISPMTIYNYVDNLQVIKKRVLLNGFDRLYAFVFSELNKLTPPVDKVLFCRTIALSVFRFSAGNRNVYTYMFTEGGSEFCNDAEVRPFYNFMSELTRRAKATQKDYAANEKGYKLLETLIFAIAYQTATGAKTMTEAEYEEMIDYYLDSCIR